jgi:mycobactin peptide synthetase MbtE
MPMPAPGQEDTAERAAHSGNPYAYGDTIHDVFEYQAERRPDAPALLQADQVITYGRLRDAAHVLAARFAAGGMTPGAIVVVRMRRTPAFAAVLLSVLRLGGAYLAAERAWPRQYVQDIIDRADAWLVTDEPSVGLGSRHQTFVVKADAMPAGPLTILPPTRVSRDAPCTIFQTSGSTGAPKLAVVPHRSTVRVFIGAGYCDFGPGRVIVQNSPVCWDGLTMELWSVLLSGGTSLIPPEGIPMSGDLLRSCVAAYGLDTVWLTSALFSAIVDDDIGAFAGLAQVMSGGEKVSVDHVRRLRSAYPDARFVNGYGPVEATVFATTHTVADGDLERYGELPLGRPLPATTVLVLDEAGEPCGPGETGEIYVGGDALGLGYLGDPSETERRFITDRHGTRLYRTGDLGQWHDTGVLLFRGRVDRQVKIRGQRAEPGELESFISRAFPGVVAAVLPVSDDAGQVIGLIAHCGTGGRDVSPADIRRACESELPSHLRPRRIVLHDELPRNDTGKIDYRALHQAPVTADPGKPAEADPAGPDPRSVEGSISRIASGLLGTAAGSSDDLFQLGGDSLFAMRLAIRLRRDAGITVSVGQIHTERSAARLARVAVRDEHREHDEREGARAPSLNPGEQDLCLHEEIFPGDPALLLLSAFELSCDIDVADLLAAMNLVTDRHPALSSTRVAEAGIGTVRPHGLTRDEVRRQLETHLDDRPVVGEEDGALVFPDSWLEPFDLATDIPMRIYVARGPRDSRLLGLVVHHVAMDGWSEHVFITDLGDAYARVTQGPPPASPASPTPVPARSSWPAVRPSERERAREYWRALLDGLEPLPVQQAPEPGSHHLGQERLTVTKAQCQALGRLAGDPPDLHSGALAWYADGLRDVFSREDFSIGSAYAARDLTDEETIGYHVQMIPLRVRYPAGKTLDALAREMAGQWLGSLDHRSLSLRQIAACAPRTRVHGHRPVFQAGFALQRNPPAQLELAGRIQPRRDVRPPAPPFELYLEFWPQPAGGATVLLQWDPRCVPPASPQKLAARLRAVIEAFP